MAALDRSHEQDRDRRRTSAALFVLAILNLVGIGILAWRYVALAGPTDGLKHWLFVRTAVLAQIGLLVCVPAFLSLFIARWQVGRRIAGVMAPVLFALLAFFLLIDVAIYGMFRFHVNGLVFDIVTSPVMRDAMDIPFADVVFVLSVGAAILAVELLLFWGLRRGLPDPAFRPRWGALAIAVLSLFVVEKLVYMTSDLRGERHVVRSARAVPLYQRLTMRNFAQKLGVVPEKQAHVRIRPVDPSARTLQYPRNPLVFEEPSTKPNILWLNLEGWRWDMFNEENTPNIWEFSQGAQVFDYHVSGGNRTATGVFTQFYGLYGNYWDTFLSERKPPVLVNRMKELGYLIDADASREVGFFDMANSTFVDMPGVYHHDWPTDDSAVRDQAIVEHMKENMEAAAGAPFFQWVLFDSSHVKYYFPPEFAKFEPYAKQVQYREIGISEQRAIEARNRYRNAVLYGDHLVGELLDWMRERGLLEKTVVIITGDHGEEFNENGYWTHGGGCTPQVVRVPLVMHVPGRAHARYSHVTAHQDLVPTLMEMLGTKSPPGDYALGRPLFGTERIAQLVACGWDQSALIDESGWLIFGNDFQNPWDYEVRDPEYREVPDTAKEIERRTAQVATTIRSMNAFLK